MTHSHLIEHGKRLAQNFKRRFLGAALEEPQLHTRRYTGDLVNFIGVIGIIAVMSIVVVAALIGSSSVAAVMPDWSERQLAELAR